MSRDSNSPSYTDPFAPGLAPVPPVVRGRNASSSTYDALSPSPRDFAQFVRSGHNESPLSRAGLLQPQSYISTMSRQSRPKNGAGFAHSAGDIRDHTMQLSSRPIQLATPTTTTLMSSPNVSQDAFIFPTSTLHSPAEEDEGASRIEPLSASISSVLMGEDVSSDLSASTSTISTQRGGVLTPRGGGGRAERFQSGIALLRSHQEGLENVDIPASQEPTPTGTPKAFADAPVPAGIASASVDTTPPTSDVLRQDAALREPPEPEPERRTLLGDVENGPTNYHSVDSSPSGRGGGGPQKSFAQRVINSWRHRLSTAPGTSSINKIPAEVVRALPAVLLGGLLNILDGVSYGMIIFPAAGVFAGLGGVGVSMFFVTAVVSQLLYSAGGSGFAGANGSMMIEVVPFFHILAQSISDYIGEDRPHEVLATTMVAFAFSSLLTGVTFFVLGYLRMGSLIGFFPRHILVGCIGGVGVFLIITGLTVCTRITEDDFDLSLATLKFFLLNAYNLALWVPPFALAVLLRVITAKYHHQLIFPLYFILIPVVFYMVVAAARLDVGSLRGNGWLFDMDTADEPWYRFWTFFDFRATNWGALWDTLPTQFALLFFNILHPPLNVPALAVSLNHDVDTDKELVAHGYSNILAGLLGTVPNYLVYVNTLLFYRVGGDTRISGFLLAGANVALLLIGTGPIAYLPVMVVGALIFVLGIDLVKEALWDTRHRVNRWEYITIASIMVCMTVWDFVIGVIFGIIMSCFFFVVQNSQRRSIRVLHTGETAMSTVRRPGAHRAYIREVSKQTTILRLQGFIFFGTITYVEGTIRTLVEAQALQRSPIRFLILDLALAVGVDMSAAEAFVRVQRLLATNRIVLVLCGFTVESPVGKALKSVGLLEMDGVEVFADYTEALEWTENAYLSAWFMSRKLESDAVPLPARLRAIEHDSASLSVTPRRSQMLEVGFRTIARDDTPPELLSPGEREPLNTILKAFSSYGPLERERFRPLVRYLEPRSYPAGHVLWSQGDAPDGLYIVEDGILRAIYQFADYTSPTYETMMPGTLAGELSMLSGLERNATCVVERDAKVWKLSGESLRRLQVDEPELAREFTQLVLKSAKLDYDILLSALASRQ
ncbi:hypothetical protein EIP91_003725 [Steccherinum ochraceum]|uniref:STAS domain-containing protein n=1 Tax=Steccherinum ochraceum TaxID=92696 RepID=A0A4R0RST0_9APHY|nr:hypothetical protein EIP91_003725 [Steccherinum ochraceum]